MGLFICRVSKFGGRHDFYDRKIGVTVIKRGVEGDRHWHLIRVADDCEVMRQMYDVVIVLTEKRVRTWLWQAQSLSELISKK